MNGQETVEQQKQKGAGRSRKQKTSRKKDRKE